MEIIKKFDDLEIGIIFIKEEPYFRASTVCKNLGLKNVSRALSSLDKDDITQSNVIDALKRNIEVYYISENGLYDLIFKSKKKEAKRFQKWVTHEVLPSIRKTGKYSIPENIKQISTKSRNDLTDAWKECGIEKPYEYIQLTLQEYKALNFEKGKRKKDLNKEEVLLLSALESMERLNLFYDRKEGYYECKDSLQKTANNIKEIIKKPIKKIL